MRKFQALICLFTLLLFAGSAYAVVAGHVNTAAKVNKTPAVTYNPTSADVTTSPTNLDITVEPLSSTPASLDAPNLRLPEATTNEVAVMTNIRVGVTGYTPRDSITFNFANYPGTQTENLYAALRANKTEKIGDIDYVEGMYYGHEATVSGGVLSFTVNNPEIFFSSNDVVIATAKTVSDNGGGGGGGCNAGFGGLLLLAALPLFYLKKK